VRALGALAEIKPWALQMLIRALGEEPIPRSRVAAHLDVLAPRGVDELVALLGDETPAVRYWAAMLLSRDDTAGTDRLIELLHDPDAAVRRAAVEALGVRRAVEALPGVLDLLADETMYVRAHACRAAGRLGGVAVADRILPLLGDRKWWVRSAAKDTLRAFGPDVLGVLIPVLHSPDRFARNGAAEVLQDVGVLDRLARSFPQAPIVAEILAAGEDGIRKAADGRLWRSPRGRRRRRETRGGLTCSPSSTRS
ncbi:MAG: hypothetical protein FJW96_01115, partial [Actinobacteria bacterium]|nr:hypothetical protein [Actinomycetota bacterium]